MYLVLVIMLHRHKVIGKNDWLLSTGDAGSSCTGPCAALECKTEQGT